MPPRTSTWFVLLSLVRTWVVLVPVRIHPQGIYYPPNTGGRSIVFRILFQQTNKQTNKQTNRTPAGQVRITVEVAPGSYAAVAAGAIVNVDHQDDETVLVTGGR